MSLELVLLVPVLVLLTVFVLWAGRGGRAALTADLAAEEAATVAALCCEEDEAGAADREALVEDMLEARPGLGFLCIGGPRPNAGGGSDKFLSEHWLEFEPGRDTGGVGVLGVQFLCESDGAVAPLRGLFPTVTFHGQAAEVVQREPRLVVGFAATRFPVTEGDSRLVFTVRVQPTFGDEVTLTYRLDRGETTAEPQDFDAGVSDFAGLSRFKLDSGDLVGTVVILAGQDQAEIVLPLVDDDFFEGTEQLVLELTGADPPGVELDDHHIRATGVIEDNDPRPFLQIIGTPQVTEGGTLNFEVRVGVEVGGAPVAEIAEPFTVQVSTVDAPDDSCCIWATPTPPGQDYTAVMDLVLTFRPGEALSMQVPVVTLDDDGSPEGEVTENVRLILSDPSADAPPLHSDRWKADGTILDDEAKVSSILDVTPADATEGDPVVFEVTLDRGPIADVTLDYTFKPDGRNDAHQAMPASGDSCTDGDDYLGAAGQVTIIAGSQQATFPVQTCEDLLVERDETFWVELSRAQNGGEVDVPAGTGEWGTIRDDDIPVVSVSPAEAEGTEGQTDRLAFTVSLTVDSAAAQLTEDVTVDYEIGEYGTDPATAPGEFGEDYAVTLDTATPPELLGLTLQGTLTFAAGPPALTQHLFEVELLPDYLPENPETFQLDLYNLSDPVGAAVFEDTDGNPGTDDSYAVGTITDVPPPVLSVNDFTGPEGTTQFFTVTLANPRSGEIVTVDYVISGDEVAANADTATAPGHATKPADFEPDTGGLTGTVTFDPATACQTSCTVGVRLRADYEPEPDETLRLTLTNPSGAVLSGSDPGNSLSQIHGVGTITDVIPPYLVVDDMSAHEGTDLVFTVTLCNPRAGDTVTVDYRTVDREAAVQNGDFEHMSGTLEFVGSTPDVDPSDVSSVCGGDGVSAKSHTVRVKTLTDLIAENDERLHLLLSENADAALNAVLEDRVGVGTIINSNAPVVRVSNARAKEGEMLTFVISLVDVDGNAADYVEEVIVTYQTADRGSAVAGEDYEPVTGGTVTFPARGATTLGGFTTHDVDVELKNDTEDEDDEIFALVAAVPERNASLGKAEGTGTIVDRDPPALRIEDATAEEGDDLVFQVRLGIRDEYGTFVETPTSEAVSVLATTADGTATALGDYTAKTQRLEFRPGDTQIDFTVASIPDDDPELAETFWVELSGAQNARLDRADAKGTIGANCIDAADENQDPPTLTLHSGTVLEGEIEYLLLEFSQPLCPDPQRPILASLVFERVLDSTATRADLSPTSTLFGRLWLSAASTEAPGVRVAATGPPADGLDEDDEYFTVQVGWAEPDRRLPYQNDDEFMPAHYHHKPWARAVVTIVDNDPLPGLTVSDADAVEGQPLTFEVVLNPQSGRTVTVEYRTVDGSGTATAGDDYTPLGSTPLVFAPGDTSLSFDVVTFPDSDAVDDTFLVEVRALDPADPDYVASNVLIIDAVAVGTILEGGKPTLRIHDAQAEEAGDGDSDVDGTLIFSVELSAPAVAPVTVDYATVQRPQDVGAATEGVDYTRADGDLTFDVGDQFQTIAVQSLHDEEPEGNETFLVELSSPSSGVSLADPSAVGTIIDDEVQCVDPRYTSDPMPYTLRGETVDEGAGRMSFTVVLPQALCRRNSLSYSAVGGTATADEDYEHVASQRYIPAFVTEWKGFHVVLYDDDIDETNETIVMRTGFAHAGFLRAAHATGTIIDNDDALLSVRDVEVGEGGAVSFGLSLDRPVGGDVTVDYATADVSAAADEDYQPVSDTATIPAGQRSASVTVRTVEDLLDEHDETFELRLSNAQGVKLATDCSAGDCHVAVGTILDDDDPPAVSVSNPSGDEGAALVFAVTLDAPSGRAGSVTYSTRDGPTIGGATAGADYGSESGPLAFVAFAAGETAKTVSVQTLTDDEVEGSERFFLDLSSSDFGFDKDIGTGTIRDVTQRRVSVSDASVLEGGVLKFVAGFNGPPASRDITVEYSTVADTAEAGIDYSDAVESSPRVLRILAGNTSAVVRVQTLLDTLDEDLEQLKLVLSDPVGAVLAGGEAVGTIIDDDPEPLLSVDDPEATENGDGTPVVFTLRLSEESGRDVSVGYSTVDITAKAGADYQAVSNGQATILAGTETVPMRVTLVNDDDAEEVERFQLVLSDPSNARFGDRIGAATILDDDALPQILIDDAAAVYEAAGASVSFPVRLSREDPDNAVTVEFATEDATATAGEDYTAASGPLAFVTFAAGQIAITVAVDVLDDDIVEETETFRLVLSNPSSNATLGTDDSAVATVLDDDALPKLSVADAPAATEGAAATFAVELSRQSTRPVTVAYAAVVDPFGGDAAAIPGQDFEAVTGTLTIPARGTSATVAVPLPDDALDEHTETFWLRLADPTGATVDDGTGIGMIDDDDPLPQLSVGDSGATEGDPIRFTVTLTPASGRTVTVPWTTAVSLTGNPASPTGDFVAASGTLTFASGTTAANIDIDTVDDEVYELDETFQVRLGRPTNAAVDDGVAVGAILDDDGLPRISIAGDTVLETDSPAKFIVTLSRLSSQTVTVDYATTAVTATAATGIGKDYGPPSGEATGTLVIPAGLDTGEISVYVADDDEGEETETFHITLSNAVNAVIAEGEGTAVGTILDDDGKPRLGVEDAEECEDGSSAADCEVRTCRYGIQHGGLTFERYMACQTILDDPGACPEGACTGNGTIDFAVQLSHASAMETRVRYTTFARSAADARDYVASSGTLTIPMGDTSASIPVVLVDDAIPEAVETFLLRLDNPDGVELEAAEAFGTIIDDDAPPKVSAAPFDGYANENDGFNYHRVTLSHPSDLTVSVDYKFDYVGDRSPYPGIDATAGTLTFAPGVVQQTITVPLYDNDVATYVPSLTHAYANTFYRIELNNRVNASYGQGTGAGIVWDDDTPPYVDSVAAQDTIESVGAATFTITLNRFSDQAVTATYQTVDGTATAGSDYTATTETVTFPPGTITAAVTVSILDDSVVESDESFTLSIISDARNSNLTVLPTPFNDGHGSGSGTVRIIDDDVLPEISVSDVAANENAGTVTFWVSLSRASAQDVTVDYATANATATAGSDYTAVHDTLTIPAGDTGAAVSVAIHDDATTESDETFELALSAAVGATITDGDATATIIEDDNLQTISISDKSKSENIGVYGRAITFSARLGERATRWMSVDWEVREVPSLGDEAATIGSDFLAPNRSGTVNIPTGQTGWAFSFDIVADLVPERDERFLVVLSNPVGAVLGNARAWGTILNDDLPIVSIADAAASEAADAVVFTLQLHEPGLDPTSLQYTTRVRPSEGDAAALPGDDYIETTGTLQIAAGQTTATISVRIIPDDIDEELDETFLLELSAPNGLELRDSAAVGTITDDDDGWTINDRSVQEDAGTEDAGSMVFTVIRDHTSTNAVTLNYTVTSASAMGGNSCTAGVDYITPSGSVTLLPAEKVVEITLTLCADDVAEGSESLLIELTGVPGRKLTGTGTIVDND